ncbi:hypothetical protein B484DRAFT_406032 [Ochromonadaceae sp. CCMP2298]|nr:hypothetical protein B484DRAFT_406032 [Ochromonadaceae sp. CCMP2298]
MAPRFRGLALLVAVAWTLSLSPGSSLSTLGRTKAFLRSRFKFQVDWIDVLGGFGMAVEEAQRLNLDRIDFSGGAGYVSCPTPLSNHSRETTGLHPVILQITQIRTERVVKGSIQKSSMLRVHQMSNKVIQKVPNYALLGALTLIGTELIKREVSRQFIVLPPLMQEMANKTFQELDQKLELLTSLEYNVDPFLRSEYRILQAQPIELIDKYVATEIVGKLEAELPPILSNFVSEKRTVDLITGKVVELVKLVSVVILRPGYFSYSALPMALPMGVFNISEMGLGGGGGQGVGVGAGAGVGTQGTQGTSLAGVKLNAGSEFNRIIDELGKIAKSEGLLQQVFISLGKSLQLNDNLYPSLSSLFSPNSTSPRTGTDRDKGGMDVREIRGAVESGVSKVMQALKLNFNLDFNDFS